MKVYVITSTAMFSKFFGGINVHKAFSKKEDAKKWLDDIIDKQNERCQRIGSNAGALAYNMFEVEVDDEKNI